MIGDIAGEIYYSDLWRDMLEESADSLLLENRIEERWTEEGLAMVSNVWKVLSEKLKERFGVVVKPFDSERISAIVLPDYEYIDGWTDIDGKIVVNIGQNGGNKGLVNMVKTVAHEMGHFYSVWIVSGGKLVRAGLSTISPKRAKESERFGILNEALTERTMMLMLREAVSEGEISGLSLSDDVDEFYPNTYAEGRRMLEVLVDNILLKMGGDMTRDDIYAVFEKAAWGSKQGRLGGLKQMRKLLSSVYRDWHYREIECAFGSGEGDDNNCIGLGQRSVLWDIVTQPSREEGMKNPGKIQLAVDRPDGGMQLFWVDYSQVEGGPLFKGYQRWEGGDVKGIIEKTEWLLNMFVEPVRVDDVEKLVVGDFFQTMIPYAVNFRYVAEDLAKGGVVWVDLKGKKITHCNQSEQSEWGVAATLVRQALHVDEVPYRTLEVQNNIFRWYSIACEGGEAVDWVEVYIERFDRTVWLFSPIGDEKHLKG